MLHDMISLILIGITAMFTVMLCEDLIEYGIRQYFYFKEHKKMDAEDSVSIKLAISTCMIYPMAIWF